MSYQRHTLLSKDITVNFVCNQKYKKSSWGTCLSHSSWVLCKKFACSTLFGAPFIFREGVELIFPEPQSALKQLLCPSKGQFICMCRSPSMPLHPKQPTLIRVPAAAWCFNVRWIYTHTFLVFGFLLLWPEPDILEMTDFCDTYLLMSLCSQNQGCFSMWLLWVWQDWHAVSACRSHPCSAWVSFE